MRSIFLLKLSGSDVKTLIAASPPSTDLALTFGSPSSISAGVAKVFPEESSTT